MDINVILYYLIAFDALGVILLGLFAAATIALGYELKTFWDRVVPACIALVVTSFAAGILLWIADSMFMG